VAYDGWQVGPNGEKMYSGLLDVGRKIVGREGVRGLYEGLVPNLVGIFPEKAIKLGVNDFLRLKLRDDRGEVSLARGALAGAVAGFTQCVATNPMEIVKIRLQVRARPPSSAHLALAHVTVHPPARPFVHPPIVHPPIRPPARSLV